MSCEYTKYLLPVHKRHTIASSLWKWKSNFISISIIWCKAVWYTNSIQNCEKGTQSWIESWVMRYIMWENSLQKVGNLTKKLDFKLDFKVRIRLELRYVQVKCAELYIHQSCIYIAYKPPLYTSHINELQLNYPAWPNDTVYLFCHTLFSMQFTGYSVPASVAP